MSNSNDSYEQKLNLDRLQKYVSTQEEALTTLAKMRVDADANGLTFNAVELQKIERIVTNALVRVIRLYHAPVVEHE